MTDLNQLARERVLAKQAEDAAVAKRRAIDEQIAEILANPATIEGTVTRAIEGFKVSVSYGVTRKLDTKKLQEEWTKLPARVQSCINWKADLSVSKFRALDQSETLELSAYMEAKPAAPSVKVEITSGESINHN